MHRDVPAGRGLTGGSLVPGGLLRDVVAPFTITRAALAVVALLAGTTVPPGAACRPCDLSTIGLVNVLSRWDTGAYLEIARGGYSYEPGTHSDVTFFPLLPILMRVVAIGRTDSDALLVAGLLVSNVALIVALAQMVALGRPEVGEDAARRAALYVLVFPTTVFLSAAYPGSLFLALAAAMLLAARQARWWRAGALAALAALARPFGVLVALPLAVEALAQRREGGRLAPVLAATIAPVAAFAAWQLFLYRATGDPLVFLTAQAAYGRHPAGPWDAVGKLADPSVYGFPWFVLAIFFTAVALVALSWWRLRPSIATYGTALVVATASSGTLASFPRYVLTLVPMFLVLGALGHRRTVHLTLLVASSVLATLLTAMYAAWYWIG